MTLQVVLVALSCVTHGLTSCFAVHIPDQLIRRTHRGSNSHAALCLCLRKRLAAKSLNHDINSNRANAKTSRLRHTVFLDVLVFIP